MTSISVIKLKERHLGEGQVQEMRAVQERQLSEPLVVRQEPETATLANKLENRVSARSVEAAECLLTSNLSGMIGQ